LRRVRTSYPPPRYFIAYDISRDLWRDALIAWQVEERLAMEINRPEAFVIIASVT
jgi:hypothetical protein